MAQRKSLNVNGKAVQITIDDPEMPLLYALRDDLALHGPRFGCGLGQCGACVPCAISNAVFDAIGVRLRSVPYTPERCSLP